jgi:biotin carboxylase
VGAASARDARRLLVLGAGPAQLGLLKAARERGLFVIACDRDPAAPGFEYANRRALVSAEDEEGLDRLARAERVDGVIAPGIDWPVAIAARIAARLRIPHPLDPEAATLCTQKLRQRERLAEAGVPQPSFVLCDFAEEAEAAAASLGYPCVVKAPDRQGQRGLTLVAEPSGLREAVRTAIEASRTGACLVEEYVPGREVTVNAFSVRGRFQPLTVTDRLTADPPAFGVALAHAWPAAEAASAAGVARRAAQALGVGDGPTYTQVVLGPDGARVVELAARLGGGHDAELCREALGVDLNRLALGAALGEDAEAPVQRPRGGACVRFLVASPGELRRVDGLDRALEVEGVVEARSYRRPGFVFGPLRRGADRAGFVLAVGRSREDALARAGAAAERIRFVTTGNRFAIPG